MDVKPVPEQEALTEVVRGLVTRYATPERVAEIADGEATHDDALLHRLIGELGVGALLAGPDALLGTGVAEAAIVVGELGRFVAPVPYMSSCVLALTALAAGEDDTVDAVASGELRATLAMPSSAAPVDAVGVAATIAHGGLRLDGQVDHVLDGVGADLFVVLADAEGRPAWAVVEKSADGVTVAGERSLDTTRPLARVMFVNTVARPLASEVSPAELADHLVDLASLCLAREQASAAGHLLDVTVAHASDRIQFGRPIGSFQAVQHRLADLALAVDELESAATLAVWAASAALEELSNSASAAAVVAAERGVFVAEEAIQIHGGIGFTWEHVCQRYFRRALASASLFGRPEAHRDRLLRSLPHCEEVRA